ncbi:TPA: hypothetical protein I9Y90_000036 [Elizabethkingia anophelis]|nr:hypothetical protein [Elizabethkingia anophelis]HAT4009559.1 hypothetical protein [Elizabethkingia anophelis]
MKYTIKRNNNIIAQVEPQGNISTKIMGEELVNMTFELPTMVKFQIGDSVNVYGANYYLLQAPVVEKVNTRHFKYSLQFGSIIYELSKIQLLFPDAGNNLTVPEGNPIGNADLLIGHVLNNANRLQPGWTKGTVIETEAKQVDFSEDNCLSALAKIAEAFEVEYWIDADKSIHIVERKSDSGYSFQYGKNKGLKSITRNPMDGSNIVTRLYALGSEKNIGAKYRNGSKRLKMDVPYLEKNTDIYNVIEHTKKFDEVYPKRIGTVTAVDANNPLVFTDSTMDFDLNERDGNGTTILIQGIPAKVTFQTGQLAGYILEIKENGYHTATKTFTLNKNKDEKAIEVPSNLMRPKVGDQYIITDIVMPASYVTNAEAELKVKAQEYLDKNCKERLQYTVVSDPFYFKEINANIALGKTIHFTDADLGLDANLRILSISKDLQNPYKVAFEIGEDAAIISIVRAYIEKEKQQTAIIKEQKYNAQLARRSYAMAREEFDKYFDNSGYLDPIRIKPESIETGMLMVGTRSQQLSLPDVVITVGADNTSLKNTAGQLVHLTVDPKAPRTWQIAANTQYGLSTNFNYLYVKADKKGNNATLMATEVKLLLDSDPVFYYFLIGSVSSVVEGFRRVKVNAGYTSVAPGEITTGRISSADGSNWIDLLQDRIEINARVRFAPGSQAQNYVDNLFNTANQNTKDAISNINFGSVNLLDNTAVFAMSANDVGLGTSVLIENEREKFYRATPDSGKRTSLYGAYYTLEPNQEYVRGIYVRHSDSTAQDVRILSHNTNGGGDKITTIQPNTWTFIKTNVINGSGGSSALIMEMFTPNIALDYKKTILVKGNRLGNDWTPSSNDINKEITIANQNAHNAQNTANTAEQNAINANQKLADISNDNLLTVSKKPEVMKEWDIIASEYDHIIAQAATYNVNSANYTYFFNGLSGYLISINWNNLAFDSPIDGGEFRRKFKEYYTERTDLLKRISDTAKNFAKDLVDNIKIGGENLVDYSNNPVFEKPDYIASSNVRIESNNPVTDGFLVHTLGNAGSGWMQFDIQSLWNAGLVKGKTYTISIETWSLWPLRIGIDGENLGNPLENQAIPASKEWKRIYRTFVYAQNSPSTPHYLIYFDGEQGTNYALRNLKLEEGTQATPWSRSQADINRQIKKAQDDANAANNSIASLGVLAWKNAVEKAMLGDTIIEGGYIKTELINAQSIVIGGGGVTNNQLSTTLSNIQIGSRNLLLKSNTQLSQPPGVYRIGGYMTSKLLEVGKTYTLMFKSGNGGRASVGAWVNGYQHIGANDVDGGIKTFTFTVENTGRELNVIDFYKVPDTDTDRWSAVNWAVLVEGNKMGLQSWIPAPEDVDGNINTVNQNAQNAQNTANSAQNSANNAQTSANNAQNSANSAINAANGLQNQVNRLSEDIKIKLLASSYAYGKCLYRDVNFRDGLNGAQVYNNAGNGNVSLVHWIGGAAASQAPTKSTNVLAIEYNGQGADPYNGGFYFGTQTRANAVFVVRIIMKLATGQDITFHSNAAGDNYKFDWVTPAIGTGKWEEYIGVLRCGATGAFSSSMFFAFFGASVPLSTYICYASVFDLTDVEKDIYTAVENMQVSLNDVKTKTDNFTSIQGGLIMSNIMSVGSTQIQQNAFLSGVTDNGALSIRIGAGANYANKNAAPFRVLDNGKMFASDAEITGIINANSGRIGQFNIQGSSLIASSTGQPGNSWDPWSSFAMITPEMVLFRTNGANSDSVKEAGFGITQSAGTGSDGAMGFIKHNIQNYGGTNIGLRVQAKNATENIALDILDGDIRVKGQKGYTGQWRGFWVQNGLIVSVY